MVLLFDRENQQPLPQRGLLPARSAALRCRAASMPLTFVSYAHRKSDRP